MTKRNPFIAILKDMVYHGLETYGRYYSCYRGFVFDNVDPLNNHRVRLVIPEVGGNTPYQYWAHPKGQFSGEGYGMQLIPQKGDLVWVEFERGHPDCPLYSHGYRGNGELPTDDPDLANVNCYWFRSPYGHTVKIDDTKKSITIQTNGAKIQIDENGLIALSNENTDLKSVLTNILKTYMKTETIMGGPLVPGSIQDAVDNLQELNKLLS